MHKCVYPHLKEMSHYRTHKHVHTKKDFVDLHGIAKGQYKEKNLICSIAARARVYAMSTDVLMTEGCEAATRAQLP